MMTISVILRHVAYYDSEESKPKIHDRRLVFNGVEDYEYKEALCIIMKEMALNEYILNIRFLYSNPFDLDDIKLNEPISKGEYITHTEPKTPHELSIRMEDLT